VNTNKPQIDEIIDKLKNDLPKLEIKFTNLIKEF
jgi:hypothetical protein